MQNILLIGIGGLLLYLAATGRLSCLGGPCWSCIKGAGSATGGTPAPASTGTTTAGISLTPAGGITGNQTVQNLLSGSGLG